MTKARRSNRESSIFASTLRRLLDSQKARLSHADWAEILGVSPAAISQWLADKTIPSPEYLRDIVSVVERDDSAAARSALKDFRDIAARPCSELSSLSYRFGASLGEYLIDPLRKQFMRDLCRLPSDTQERLLLTFSETCMNEAGIPLVTGKHLERQQTNTDDAIEGPNGLKADLSSFSREELLAASGELSSISVPFDELGSVIAGRIIGACSIVPLDTVKSLCLAAIAAALRINNQTPAQIYRELLAAHAIDYRVVTLPVIRELMNALCILNPNYEILTRDVGNRQWCKSCDVESSESLSLGERLGGIRSREVRYAFTE